MIINLHVATSEYDIVIEKNALDNIASLLNLNRKVLVVTDSGVPTIYSEKVRNASKEGYIYTIEQGEESKNLSYFEKILTFMLEKGFSRHDVVVAVGGGVVGDLSGFVASAYMRGVDFYNIPTTLLSQVDSSIGGKVAVDLNGTKNIVGAFYQPKKVIVDTNTLTTLNSRQLNAGLIEAIKMAATFNKELFDFIENCINENALFDNLELIIKESLLIKKNVVEIDEKETGLRKVLNFGHTIGHGIESLGSRLHGECVGLGMIFFSSEDIQKRLIKILSMLNIETTNDLDREKVYSFLTHDKKSNGDGTITAIVVNEIGSYEMKKYTLSELKDIINNTTL